MSLPIELTPTVAIVGGGPAGLTCAAELARRYKGDVLVLERENELGGIPRHSDHAGYGVRDLRRFLTGPAYARRLATSALAAGITSRTSTQVTSIDPESLQLEATSPTGLLRIKPQALVLATGARERARAARRIPGDRPAGVLTTGQLQNMVHLHGQRPGRNAVVVGAELVSWSAVMTLHRAGCKTTALVSEHSRAESYGVVNHVGRALFRTDVVTDARVVRVHGKKRVEALEIEHRKTGRRKRLECDTVVFTGDWVPDHELARMAGLEMEPVSKAPRVDSSLSTSRLGVFAVGNVLHPVETADCAALDGRHAARHIMNYLDGKRESPHGVNVTVAEPLCWVFPNVMRPGGPAPARHRLVAWTDEFIAAPTVSVKQAERLVSRTRVPWPAAPGRVFRIPSSVLRGLDLRGEDVVISVS